MTASPESTAASARIAVVVPCYRVASRVLGVLAAIPPLVSKIYCVDDACPERSGDHISAHCSDPRVVVLRHAHNGGVGAAMLSGYRAALADGMHIVVKLDGDGQMDPLLIPRFVRLLLAGEADYCKGNRFHRPASLTGMPPARLFGNAVLSFFTKLSSGYWQTFDPNNGYTAIHASALRLLPLDDIDHGYFFESDMLCRLNIARAVVRDIPMDAVYGDETSSLRIHRVITQFAVKHVRNTLRRVFYNYYLRDFNLASIEAPLGLAALLFGVVFGGAHWLKAFHGAPYASAGTVMVAALPIIVGVQMLLSAINYDVQNVPGVPLQKLFADELADDSRPLPTQLEEREHQQP
ncbi:MAG: glycosyltransferase family 2 protein [Proteobacteria bacterium]|nr:glycosyltransferase family 2 protein [Pseudomonadota bacterium]